MLPARHSAALVLALLPLAAGGEPESARPFELPTYAGDKPVSHAPDKPEKPGAMPDAKDLYQRALDCWPAQTFIRSEVFLEGRVRTDQTNYLDDAGTIRGGNRSSVALVARVPLFSALELDREREREYMRRTKLAEAVGTFVTSLSERQKARRELDLMRALERRAQERVKIGVTETAEQVKYLERVATLEGDLMRLSGLLQKSRLELVGHCTERAGDVLDRHLVQFIEGRT